MTPSQFIAKYGDLFATVCLGTGLFPSVKLAQAALESGWGRSMPGNNMFGIKASGAKSPYWNGDTVTSGTSEYQGGSYVPTTSRFRKYPTVGDSIRDHTWFLQKNGRYAAAGVFTASTPEEQARALQRAGYATDPQYASKLIRIIDTYGLRRYDKKKHYEMD